MGGLEIGEAEGLAVELEAVPQHVECALGVQFLDQCCQQQRLKPGSVQCPHLGPELELRVRDERKHLRWKERTLLVPFGVAAGRPTAARQQDIRDVGLEGVLVGLAGHYVGIPRLVSLCRLLLHSRHEGFPVFAGPSQRRGEIRD